MCAIQHHAGQHFRIVKQCFLPSRRIKKHGFCQLLMSKSTVRRESRSVVQRLPDTYRVKAIGGVWQESVCRLPSRRVDKVHTSTASTFLCFSICCTSLDWPSQNF